VNGSSKIYVQHDLDLAIGGSCRHQTPIQEAHEMLRSLGLSAGSERMADQGWRAGCRSVVAFLEVQSCRQD